MMSRSLRTAVAVLFVALLSACTTFKVGHDFDVALFTAKIQQGVTTESQVRAWLGDPAGVGVAVEPDGQQLDQWNYYYAEGDMSKMNETRIKILQVKFDKQGKVRSYNWSTSK